MNHHADRRRPGLRALSLTLSASTASVLAAGTFAPADAARNRVQTLGLGTSEVTAAGATYAADVSGSPFEGPAAGRLTPDDGTMPAVGQCEGATATLRVDASASSRYYELAATGQVCGVFLPLGVMHRFTGPFRVAATDVPRLTKVTGVTDFRLMNGQSDLYAIG